MTRNQTTLAALAAWFTLTAPILIATIIHG